MKNLLCLLGFSLFLLFGCVKEEATMFSNVPGIQKTETMPLFQPISFYNSLERLEMISMDNLKNCSGDMWNTRTSPNSSVNVNCNPFPDWHAVFSGMENNKGLHGSGHIWNIDYLSFKFEVECMVFDSNEATYGAEITELYYATEAWLDVWGDIIQPGRHILLKVVDNGEGQNAPPDQICEYFLVDVFPFPSGPLCDYFPTDDPIWSPTGYGHLIDLEHSNGNPVQVK
jgi:hypothetical protein